MRVREERKTTTKRFLPRSTEFHWSVFIGPRTKVHRIDEGYAWVPKTWDISENLNEDFVESKVSGLGSVQEVPSKR